MYFNYRVLRFIGKVVLKMLEFIAVGMIFIAILPFNLTKYIYRTFNNYRVSQKLGYNIEGLIDNLQTMHPRQFEMFCCNLFKAQGYKAKLTPASCDGGKDIILEKNGMITFVECKRFSDNNLVGREICQKLLGSMAQYGADYGIVITTSTFHKNAIECRKSVDNLELYDKEDILAMIMTLKSEELPKIMLKTLNYA